MLFVGSPEKIAAASPLPDTESVGSFQQHAPREVIQLALSAANAIGDGLYGVDIKTVNGQHVLMEVNDNPNIDRGVEDAVLGDELYHRIMKVFRTRVDAGKQFKPAG